MAKTPRSPAPDDDSPETDESLWDRVTETAQPLTRGRNRARFHDGGNPEKTVPPAGKPRKRAVAKPVAPKAPQEKKPTLDPPPLGTFERREMRGLGAGRIDIDARIDLHGMRQHEAHQALKAFLVRSQSNGHRRVLVITGKGGQRPSSGSGRDDGASVERGVLRSAVPRWLNEPGFRDMVVSFTAAAPRHGGDGALYVRLRRTDRNA